MHNQSNRPEQERPASLWHKPSGEYFYPEPPQKDTTEGKTAGHSTPNRGGSGQTSADPDNMTYQGSTSGAEIIDMPTQEEDSSSQNRTKNEKKKHWPVVLAVCMAFLLLGGGIFAYFNVHLWADATCTAPRTCRICRKEDGSPLGHHLERADCESPEVCSVCGQVGSPAAGHKWTKATCDTPQTCQICGAVGKPAAGHTWTAATCTAPKACSVCGTTQGTTAPHNWKKETVNNYAYNRVETLQTCTKCGFATSSTLKELTTLIDGSHEHFILSPTDFYERLLRYVGEYDRLSGLTLRPGRAEKPQTGNSYEGTYPITVDVYEGDQKIAVFYMGDYPSGMLTEWDAKPAKAFNFVLLWMDIEIANTEYPELPMVLMAACDPETKKEGNAGLDVMFLAQQAFIEGNALPYNGIIYFRQGDLFQAICEGAPK